MIQKLSHLCIPVPNYDEAIDWYQEKLGFQVRSNSPMGPELRWVTMSPPNQDIEIILYLITKEENDPRLHKAGNLSGWVLETDNCQEEVDRLRLKGVKISMEPNEAPWGIQAVFHDLYGNTFVLLEPRKQNPQVDADDGQHREEEIGDPTER
ncbi:VOC family protein [Risungbinella massiliensis]|uniref:VOC family protein n=1 Tax=Risungbinella massiliensis TaxID=1329796 RepID=UPI00069AF46E|nr:VOC family protein [Risungbinella massiliensis]